MKTILNGIVGGSPDESCLDDQWAGAPLKYRYLGRLEVLSQEKKRLWRNLVAFCIPKGSLQERGTGCF